MPSVKGNHWSFTLNFKIEEGVPELVFSDAVQYAIWQHEKVEHDHLQGYLQMVNRNSTMNMVKAVFGELKPHLQKVTINDSGRKPWEYASKTESRVSGPWEYGIRIEKGSNKRSKIAACERSPERMAIEDPDMFRMFVSHKKMKIFNETYVGPVLNRPWQLRLQEELDFGPNDRKIIWVYGQKGGEGKSTFAKSLVQKQGFAYIDPSKYADMFEMYHQQGTEKHVVADFHRSCDVDTFYGFLEKIKNRVIPKLKYRSCVHFEMNDIHCVVMANVLPNYEKISEDRIILIDCESPTSVVPPILYPARDVHKDEVIVREEPLRVLPNGYKVLKIKPGLGGSRDYILLKPNGSRVTVGINRHEDFEDYVRDFYSGTGTSG